jgi:thymidylate kinase
MKLLILEGIATSGKSTTIRKLRHELRNENIVLYSEEDTHIPIMDKPQALHIDFFRSLITKAIATKADLVIFDRFYLTQAFRANATIDVYTDIENSLLLYPVLTVFLKIDEDVLAERIRLATLHREGSWGKYVKTKGDTFTEIADYYISQQRSQLELLEKSKLKYVVLDTTRHEYERIISIIKANLNIMQQEV